MPRGTARGRVRRRGVRWPHGAFDPKADACCEDSTFVGAVAGESVATLSGRIFARLTNLGRVIKLLIVAASVVGRMDGVTLS